VRLGRAFLQTFVVQVIQSAASLTTGVLIARALGPSEQGRYAFLAAALGVGALIVGLGQFQGNVLSAAENPSLGRVLLLRSATQSLGVATILASVQLVGAHIPGTRTLADIAYVFIAVLCVEAMAQTVRGINLGQHDITAFNAGTFVQRSAYLGLAVVLRQTHKLTLHSIAIAWFAAAAASVLLSSVLAWSRSGLARITLDAIRTGWGTSVLRGARALLSVGLGLVLVRYDVYVLGPILGMALVGQISVATAVAEWLWYVPSILNNLLFAASAADTRARSTQQIARATRLLVTLLLPVAIALGFLGGPLVRLLYGSAYAQAGVLFVLLVPGVTALALHMVVDSYFAGKGFPAISLWAPAAALAAKFVLNLLLVPRYGAAGAVTATSLVYTLLLATKVVAFSREQGIPVAKLLWPTRHELAENAAAARVWIGGRA